MRSFTVPVFSTAQFSFHKDSNAFVAELSDLAVDADYHFVRQFKLKSAKTGKEMSCAHRQTYTDCENDITHWEFAVFDPEQPGVETDLKVTIFND